MFPHTPGDVLAYGFLMWLYSDTVWHPTQGMASLASSGVISWL